MWLLYLYHNFCKLHHALITFKWVQITSLKMKRQNGRDKRERERERVNNKYIVKPKKKKKLSLFCCIYWENNDENFSH